jgi:hypothetical protein
LYEHNLNIMIRRYDTWAIADLYYVRLVVLVADAPGAVKTLDFHHSHIVRVLLLELFTATLS